MFVCVCVLSVALICSLLCSWLTPVPVCVCVCRLERGEIGALCADVAAVSSRRLEIITVTFDPRPVGHAVLLLDAATSREDSRVTRGRDLLSAGDSGLPQITRRLKTFAEQHKAVP